MLVDSLVTPLKSTILKCSPLIGAVRRAADFEASEVDFPVAAAAKRRC